VCCLDAEHPTALADYWCFASFSFFLPVLQARQHQQQAPHPEEVMIHDECWVLSELCEIQGQEKEERHVL
jgi:hypothetical protein